VGALERLWLTYWRLPEVERWRERWPGVHLIFPTLPLGRRGLIEKMDRLAELQVDAINIFHLFCSRRLIEAGRARGLSVFAWGVRRARSLERVVANGADGVFCDDVEAMVRVLGAG
jgi:glycerophosphoryl diester phosphodiesterase